MRIIILGAGAIGSLFGAKLSKLNDVTLIARKEHADRINREGLKITGLENSAYKLKASAEVDEIKDNTLVVLAAKVYDSKSAIIRIKNLLRKDTTILCLQNGLYSENIVKKIVGKKCRVLRAITNFGASFLEPGVVSFNTRSYTYIEKSPSSKDIAENFSKCRLNGHVSENIKYEIWKKLVFNCALNPVTAILKIRNGGICEEKLDPLKRLVSRECAAVAKKDGVEFDFDFVAAINREFAGSTNISSMQQDLLKGKKTEISYLNGAVAELGKKYGIECPVNEALASMINYLESLPDKTKL